MTQEELQKRGKKLVPCVGWREFYRVEDGKVFLKAPHRSMSDVELSPTKHLFAYEAVGLIRVSWWRKIAKRIKFAIQVLRG